MYFDIYCINNCHYIVFLTFDSGAYEPEGVGLVLESVTIREIRFPYFQSLTELA